MKPLFAIFILFLVTGCTVGQWRVFKASVPAPIGKSAATLEAERRAADLIARKIEAPAELKPVAQGLSASLGAPSKPLKADTPEDFAKAADTSAAELRSALVAMQKQITRLNVDLIKYQGKAIEGTGFSMFGPGMTTIIIALIVLAVACPPALTLMAFAYRRLKAASKSVVNGLEEAAKDPKNREAVQEIKKKYIGGQMKAHPINTATLENVILDLKKA